MQRASEEHWEAVKETRLRALADAPQAFGSTLDREVHLDKPEWQSRVANGHWFLASSQGRPVGIAAGVGRPDERQIVSMWVEPDHRGSGAAAKLVEAICAEARSEGSTAITLWVADGNARARRFYERLGFRSTGERQPLPSAPEIGEERMRMSMPPVDG